MMNECISLAGLRKIVEMEKKPDHYKSLVVKYLRHKADYIRQMNDANRETEYLEFQFIEAVKLAKKVGVVWTGKIIF